MDKFKSLVEMQRNCCQKYRNQELYGESTEEGYKWITFKEFGELVDHFRSGLVKLGLNTGDSVAVIARNCTKWAVGAYATYSAGAIYCPMYEAQQVEEWKYIVNDCKAKILLVYSQEIFDHVKDFLHEIETLQHIIIFEGNGENSYWELIKNGQEHPSDAVFPNEHDTMGLIYTSGTTGQPKGVELSHRNIIFNLESLIKLLPIGSNDRTLSFLPWAHVFGQVAEVHGLIYTGASSGIAEGPDKILENIKSVRPTVLFSVPRLYNKIYDGVQAKMSNSPWPIYKLFKNGLAASRKKRLGQESLSLVEIITYLTADKIIFKKIRDKMGGRLKYAVSGASALGAEIADFMDDLGVTIYEGYGLSETSPLISANCPGGRVVGSVGKVIPGVKIKIDPLVLDEVEREGRPGEGEIVVWGDNVMKGYFGLPEETSKVMTSDGGFRTGDLGRLDDGGFLYITGRIKEQYKLENGKYVVPAPVEEKYKISPYIQNIFLFGSNKPYNVAVISVEWSNLQVMAKKLGLEFSQSNAFLKKEEVQKLYEDEINNLNSKVKGFERVKKFILVEDEWTALNGLLTPTMKLKRGVVHDKYTSEIENLYQH